MKCEAEFVICVGNKGYAAALELRKIYQVIPDQAAAELNQVRVIDESGEDYLFPADFFVPVQLPQAASAPCAGQRRDVNVEMRAIFGLRTL